jgi:hypothetical protein
MGFAVYFAGLTYLILDFRVLLSSVSLRFQKNILLDYGLKNIKFVI